jgi:hypothetical protein
MSKPNSNINYEEEVDEPAFEDSFMQGIKNLLSNEFACREGIIHSASTPCLLNESVEKLNLNCSISSLKDELDSTATNDPATPSRRRLLNESNHSSLSDAFARPAQLAVSNERLALVDPRASGRRSTRSAPRT